MPYPELEISSVPPLDSKADAIVVALPPLAESGDVLEAWPGVAAALEALAFTGARGTCVRVYAPEATSRPLIAVGTGGDPAPADVRDAVGTAVRTTTGFATLSVALPGVTDADLWAAAAEGAALGGYRFAGFKKDRGTSRADRVLLHADDSLSSEQVSRAVAVADAAALVKDLVHTPANRQSPADLADAAVAAAAELPITVEVLDEDALEAGGYGGILGVGGGSDRPPRLVRLDYSPSGAQRHVALVGKGITFDTGGLSLKPAASMVGMKFDMAGAATALAVVIAAARLQLPVRVSGWLAIADNMPSGRATRPGDVLTMLDGTSVEVLNTDAEGRLVLADGLVAASRERPDLLIDVATLTGAIIVALGHRHVGVMGSDDAVAEYLAASKATGELAWHLPLPAHMEDELDSPIADLQNAKIGDPAGGSLFAGLFLQRFVGRVSDADDAARIPWVHLDIAGAGTSKSAAFGATDKGPTAVTVRSLIALLEGAGR
ncbi:leucyl aminopeptidase [Microbacterium sp. bgisy189]|uniref:leucyl aminopeptidase n=1 Tax=Microbacterium sp. bgisy189 TaxID=3413798 RepID=UPI003EBAA46A